MNDFQQLTYPGHEPAKFCDDPLKHTNSST